MWKRHKITNLNSTQGSGVTIGAFDGVHRGHQALIQQMVTSAKAAGRVPIVVTFDPLPGRLLHPESYQLLSSLNERLERIAALGVAGAVILPFNQAFMTTPATSFVTQLVDQLKMRELWAGPDFALGRDRRGDIPHLREMGVTQGFSVHVFGEIIRWQGSPVRSSRIREALRRGDIEEANGCLGYPYRLAGTIVRGHQRGRDLGFPTANLSIADHRLLPANGVYICNAHLRMGRYTAITNIGTRPTFDNGERTVEAHLLDFSADIYGAKMQLEFMRRLRPELRFTSIEDLMAQMVKDEAAARCWMQDKADAAPMKACPVECVGSY